MTKQSFFSAGAGGGRWDGWGLLVVAWACLGLLRLRRARCKKVDLGFSASNARLARVLRAYTQPPPPMAKSAIFKHKTRVRVP